MRILVTGVAGFIGSNIAKALSARPDVEIFGVDNLTNGDKFRNLVDLRLSGYLDKTRLLAELEAGKLGRFDAIFHEGACSATTERDGRYMLENNYEYSVRLLDHCEQHATRFFYASSAAVYGSSSVFKEEPVYEKPLNVYGYSKLLFDQIVRQRYAGTDGVTLSPKFQVAGFRYFNVYGQREDHKGRMASVALHHMHQFKESGKVKLFDGCDGYPAGGQMRDFVSVDDVVAVNLFFLDNPGVSGIFNLGTGRAEPFNAIAHSVVGELRKRTGLPELSLEQAVAEGLIEYIPFPADLIGRYQSFTQADISALRKAGYASPFKSVAQGVADYVRHIES